MNRRPRHQVVHLELHTSDLAEARVFYSTFLDWRPETVRTNNASSYVALDLGSHVSGGIVECGTQRSLWLPYVAVEEIEAATARASALGADVMLAPREGPAGWRSVVASPAGAEVALWQQKAGPQ